VIPEAELLPGTLDLLILKAVSLGAEHGYGVLLRIGQITGNALNIEQGARATLTPRDLYFWMGREAEA